MKQSNRHKAAPKHPRPVDASPHLHMVHRRHTGHITHKRTTSYPTLAMIVLCLGVFLACWTRYVTADSLTYPGPSTGSYSVTVSVPGPPPSLPATIESPTANTNFNSLPITVSGSCPVNTYENLYSNGVFSGVALCDEAGHYSLITGLLPGNNQLTVKDFSTTGEAGPTSNLIIVTYNPPNPPATISSGSSSSSSSSNSGSISTPSSTTNTSGPSVSGEPLVFKTNFVYEGHYVGDTTSWQLDIEGGLAPYAISVDWGDGSHNLLSRPSAGSFTVNHVYTKPGSGYRGSYVTTFTASDSNGSQNFLQLISIVNNPPIIGSTGVTNGQSGTTTTKARSKPILGFAPTQGYVLTLFKYIWPSYAVVVLMLLSFWLGERREYSHLRSRLKAKPRKPRHA